MARGNRLILTASLAAVLVTGGAAVPGAGAVPTTASPHPLAWHACPDSPDTECGLLDVPRDWAHPNGPKLRLTLARRPAADPAGRIGTLMFLPGGPGDSGVAALTRDLPDQLPRAITDRFDLVSFDPRGTGGSTPAACEIDLAEPQPAPEDQRSLTAFVHHRAREWTRCLRTSPLLGHLDTGASARDVEAIRVALGEPRISAFGTSYGTLTGQRYLELYPQRLRALALISVVDQTRPIERRAPVDAANIEDVFRAFARWAGTSSDTALGGRDAAAVLAALFARADAAPVPAPHAARPDPVTGNEMRGAVIAASYAPSFLWPQLASALAAADGGDASALREFLAPFDAAFDFPAAPIATFCADFPISDRFHDLVEARARIAREAPVMAPGRDLGGLLQCAGWPLAAPDPPHRLRVPDGVVPVLLFNPRHDPATGYAGARRVARQIPGSVLLTGAGAGHSPLTGPCQRHLTRYLVQLRLPRPGTTCPLAEPGSAGRPG